jgi:oligo-1,6-glucosidase
VPENFREINAAAAVADPDSVFHHYKALIRLRHNFDVVVNGSFDMLWPSHEQLFAYERRLGAHKLTVVVNFSNESVDVPAEIDGEVILGRKQSTLEPWGFFVSLAS